MTTETIQERRRRPFGPLLAWIWPDPKATEERRPGWLWLSSFSAWLWPSALQNEGFAPRAGMAWLLHGLWPASFDAALSKWWATSWLWSWMWPGKLMGPDGEVCALAPWHPAARAACDVVPWQHRIGRKGGMAAMMFAATAIAAPTFMEGTGPQDGGRLNLFRGGGDPADQGTGGDGGTTTEQTTGDPAPGGVGDISAFTPTSPGGGNPDTTSSNPPTSGDPGTGGGGGGPTTGGNPDPSTPDGTTPTGGGDGVTFIDPNPNGGGAGGGGGGGAGGGGFFGGGGGGSGGGTGGGGTGGTGDGGTTPPGTDPTNPTGGNPTTPTDPTGPTGGNPVGPPTPPSDKPTGPTTTFPIVPGSPDDSQSIVIPGGDGGPKSDNPPGGNQGIAPDAAIPEPATWAMMIVGFGAVGYAVRRRRIAANLSKAA